MTDHAESYFSFLSLTHFFITATYQKFPIQTLTYKLTKNAKQTLVRENPQLG